MGDKIKVGPYRMARKIIVNRGMRGELVRRYKRYVRATPAYPTPSDPDESVRRVVPRTDVRGEEPGGRRFSSDLDDD